MRVLVMGGTQFNGLALVHELVRTGHDVTVCNRGKSEATLPIGVHRLVADRTDHDQLRSVVGGQDWDCVYDISAYHPPDVEVMIDTLRERIGHYIFASSTNIYAQSDGLPITEDSDEERGQDQIQYGLHKLMCEDLLLAAHADHQFPATTVPFSMVFGPHNTLRDREQRMFSRLLAGRPVLVPGDGETLLQIGHVDDQARALEQVMAKPVTFGRRYNLTGTSAVTRNTYVQTLADAVGVEPNIVHIPTATMEQLWTGQLEVGSGKAAVGMDTRQLKATIENPRATLMRRRFQIAQLVQHLAPNIHWWSTSTVFSVDRIRREVGWEPQHDFSSMTAHTYEWFRRSGLDTSHDYTWDFEDQLLAILEGHR
jgi:dTDP-glucose 4,6-dehydratase